MLTIISSGKCMLIDIHDHHHVLKILPRRRKDHLFPGSIIVYPWKSEVGFKCSGDREIRTLGEATSSRRAVVQMIGMYEYFRSKRSDNCKTV